jgi:hypothetical protein
MKYLALTILAIASMHYCSLVIRNGWLVVCVAAIVSLTAGMIWMKE